MVLGPSITQLMVNFVRDKDAALALNHLVSKRQGAASVGSLGKHPEISRYQGITGPLHTTDRSLAVAEINELFLYSQMQLHWSICSLKNKCQFPQPWRALLTYILGKEVMKVYLEYGFSCDEALYPALHRNVVDFEAFASLPSQNGVRKKVHSTFSMPTLFSIISICIEKHYVIPSSTSKFFGSSRTFLKSKGNDKVMPERNLLTFDCKMTRQKGAYLADIICHLLTKEVTEHFKLSFQALLHPKLVVENKAPVARPIEVIAEVTVGAQSSTTSGFMDDRLPQDFKRRIEGLDLPQLKEPPLDTGSFVTLKSDNCEWKWDDAQKCFRVKCHTLPVTSQESHLIYALMDCHEFAVIYENMFKALSLQVLEESLPSNDCSLHVISFQENKELATHYFMRVKEFFRYVKERTQSPTNNIKVKVWCNDHGVPEDSVPLEDAHQTEVLVKPSHSLYGFDLPIFLYAPVVGNYFFKDSPFSPERLKSICLEQTVHVQCFGVSYVVDILLLSFSSSLDCCLVYM